MDIVGITQTPIIITAIHGHIEIVKYLIDKGADINAKNNDDESLLHIVANNGHLNIIKYLIENNKVDINGVNYKNQTPIMAAAINGKVKVVKLLLKYGANPEMKDILGDTALSNAIKFDNHEIIKLLKK